MHLSNLKWKRMKSYVVQRNILKLPLKFSYRLIISACYLPQDATQENTTTLVQSVEFFDSPTGLF